MRRITLLVVLFAAFLSLVGGCRPSVDELLPPITSHGANTFGCKVNKRLGYFVDKKCTHNFMEIFCVEAWMHKEEMVCIEATAHITDSKIYSSRRLFVGFFVDSIGGEWCDRCTRFDENMNVSEDSYVQLMRFDDKVVAGTFFIRFKSGEVWYDGRFDVSFDN